MTSAPSPARRRATARPMRFAAPVMRATLPCSGSWLGATDCDMLDVKVAQSGNTLGRLRGSLYFGGYSGGSLWLGCCTFRRESGGKTAALHKRLRDQNS